MQSGLEQLSFQSQSQYSECTLGIIQADIVTLPSFPRMWEPIFIVVDSRIRGKDAVV
ncbi:MAG: hypothetical protein J0L86_11705 [Flavobacteriales bacterium]|nr:hypothetical protein [Flavobacteriales bacterium]